MNTIPPIIDVDGILISSDIMTEYFCCDYEKCKGICCVEGDAGAPVTLDEIGEIENKLDAVWSDLSAQAQSIIDRQGVAYNDRDGDLVTSIVNGRECVFASLTPNPSPTGEGSRCWICTLERAALAKGLPQSGEDGGGSFIKPISCALYPIREKRLANGTVALNYHRWDVCRDARLLGKERGIRVWQFLKEPLTRRFGEEWYALLSHVAKLLG